MKKLIFITIVLIIVAATVVLEFSRDTKEAIAPTSMASPAPTLNLDPTLIPTNEGGVSPVSDVQPSIFTVAYSDSGYSPVTITIKKGDTVSFENNSSKIMWTASAVHPSHKAYPGTDISKCGISQTNMFDACKGYNPEELWGFVFNERGVWKYHNHMQSNHQGTVIVE